MEVHVHVHNLVKHTRAKTENQRLKEFDEFVQQFWIFDKTTNLFGFFFKTLEN